MATATQQLASELDVDLADEPVPYFGESEFAFAPEVGKVGGEDANVWITRLARQLSAKEIKVAKNKAMLAAFALTVNDENGVLEGQLAKLEGMPIQLLRVFHPDVKSLVSPVGTLKLRQRPLADRLTYEGEVNPDFSRTVTQVSWDKMKVKGHLKETGEIPKGVAVDEAAPEYSLTLG